MQHSVDVDTQCRQILHSEVGVAGSDHTLCAGVKSIFQGLAWNFCQVFFDFRTTEISTFFTLARIICRKTGPQSFEGLQFLSA